MDTSQVYTYIDREMFKIKNTKIGADNELRE